MKQVIVQQYLGRTQVELIRMDVVEESSSEEIVEELEKYSDLVLRAKGRLSLSTNTEFVVFNPNLGPVRFFIDEVR